jgi:hypothetical protein
MVVNAPRPKPQTPGQSMGGPFDTYFLEADQITGPYRLITYMPAFGPAAYFSNAPSKFVANVSTDDHGQKVLECFLSYSQWGQLPGNCLAYLPVGWLQMLLRFAAMQASQRAEQTRLGRRTNGTCCRYALCCSRQGDTVKCEAGN